MNPEIPEQPTNGIQDLIDFFDEKPKGKARKGGTWRTGKRSKAPRNVASRKPVRRDE